MTGTRRRPRRPTADRARLERFVVVAVLPVVLFVVLRPDPYALLSNDLDPRFYTGLGTNLDDFLAAVGQNWYFVSRWSAYLPLAAVDAVFPYATGRLLLRWALAAAVLAAVAALGRRCGWRRAHTVAAGTVVLTLPVFVRAFFSDYVEYVAVSLGFVLVALCTRPRHDDRSAAAVGVLAALLGIANPWSIVLVSTTVLLGVVLSWSGVRALVRHAVVAGAAGVVTFVAGWAFFFVGFGVRNIYRPTLAFLVVNPQTQDVFRSPSLGWLGAFTWLWAPAVLLVAAAALRATGAVRFGRVERALLVLCAVQYAIHIGSQLFAGQSGLEIPYYWAFITPAFGTATAVVLVRTFERLPTWAVGVTTAGWLAVLAVGLPSWAHVPSWPAFVALGVVAVVVVAVRPVVAAPVLLVVVAVAHLGPPPYEPDPVFGINYSPRYDLVFRNDELRTPQILDEFVWFVERMDAVPDDAAASFVAETGQASNNTAAYGAHVAGRLLPHDRGVLAPEFAAEIRNGVRRPVVVYGSPAFVAEALDNVEAGVGPLRTLVDVVHDGGLGFRLVAVTAVVSTGS
ncbi:MAG: hypothetical protein FJW83_04280 [Actinobacteria bacterium]|nr:hypothetical protein [Actinomycetota bacterium]